MKVETWAIVGKVAVALWVISALLTVVLFVTGAVGVAATGSRRGDVGDDVDRALASFDAARGW